MLHLDRPDIVKLLFQGKFGLEKEGLRVYEDASMARTPHPCPPGSHITRDFSENQMEINTSVEPSAEGAVQALEAYGRQLQQILSGLTPREYIWPFSNPPYLGGEEDIPVAQFTGELSAKTEYRKYLSRRYGKYKMTFSGIHVNYSFPEELLKKEQTLRGPCRSRLFKDSFYLELAEKTAAYGWLLVLLTAASPVLDASFYETGIRGENTGRGQYGTGVRDEKPGTGKDSPTSGEKPGARSGNILPGCPGARDIFSGMASVRCSGLGYWNAFVPVFDYTDIHTYTEGIRRYVEDGFLFSASELYYPVRIKPRGENSLSALEQGGADHLELRMIDVNPMTESGVEIKDVQFIQLFLIWLASMPRRILSPLEQIEAVQNFKNAAHYDLRSVRILMPELEQRGINTADAAALCIIEQIQAFYRSLKEIPEWVPEVLDFERKKILNPRFRYAVQVREQFSGTFLEKGMARAAGLQDECCHLSCLPAQGGLDC